MTYLLLLYFFSSFFEYVLLRSNKGIITPLLGVLFLYMTYKNKTKSRETDIIFSLLLDLSFAFTIFSNIFAIIVNLIISTIYLLKTYKYITFNEKKNKKNVLIKKTIKYISLYYTLLIFVVIILAIISVVFPSLTFINGDTSTNLLQFTKDNNIFISKPKIIFLLYNFIFIGPIIEELFFRYWLFKKTSKKSKLVGALITALVFSLFHTNFDFIIFINYLLVSLLLTYSFVKEHQLLIPILVHSGINIIGVLTSYILN